MHVAVRIIEGGAFLFTATPRMRKEFLSRQSLLWLRGRSISALRAERHTLTSLPSGPRVPHVTSFFARAPSSLLFCGVRNTHKFLAFFLKIFRGNWPMPFSLLNHSAHDLFAQRTRIPTSARSIGFCVIWVCISSSSSSPINYRLKSRTRHPPHAIA